MGHGHAVRLSGTRTVASTRPLNLALTLAPLARGPYDPTFRRAAATESASSATNAMWRTSRFPSGAVTYRLVQSGPRTVIAHAWGPGAEHLLATLPDLLGESDDPTGFTPPEPLRRAFRHAAGLRIPRTGRVLEAAVPAILEQRVTTVTAWHAWAWLLRRHGDPAPGPAPSGMRVVPDAETWARIPSWDFHTAGVDPARARTVVATARVAHRVEECSQLPLLDAHARLRALPGIGAWTSAEIAQRALGDADAVSVGDFHLAKAVGWALTGERVDDDGMLELLAPYTPHRYRVIRLLEVSGAGRAPRRGPRLSIQDHRNH